MIFIWDETDFTF